MNIYFLTALQTLSAERFYKRLNAIAPDENITTIKKVTGMNGNLETPFRVDDLIILYINNISELDIAIAKREYFGHSRLIIVLPDGRPQTIHKGLQLKPRFIDYRNSDQKILVTVVRKIADQYNRNLAWENTHYSTSYH